MLRSFFRQRRGKKGEEPSSPRQDSLSAPSALGDGPTRRRSTSISPYPGRTLESLRPGSISTPEVNTVNAVATMTRDNSSVSQGLALPRTVTNPSSLSASTGRGISEQQARGLVGHDSSNPIMTPSTPSASNAARTQNSTSTDSSLPLSKPSIGTIHPQATGKGDAHVSTPSPSSPDEGATGRTFIASTQLSQESAATPSNEAQSSTAGRLPQRFLAPSTATTPRLADQDSHRPHPNPSSSLPESQSQTTPGSRPSSATTRGFAMLVVAGESTDSMASSRAGGSKALPMRFPESYTKSPSTSSAESNAALPLAQPTSSDLSGSLHAIASAAETQPSSDEEEMVDHLLRLSVPFASATPGVAAQGPSPKQHHLSSPDPAFQFLGTKSGFHFTATILPSARYLTLVSVTAGGHIGSKNFLQQGDGPKFAYVDSSETHIHHNSPTDEHESIMSRIRSKLGPYLVDDARLLKGAHADPSLCHRGTRENLLEHILLWVEAPSKEDSDVAARAKCIVGAPGSGKSTIMNTLIVKLLDEAARRSPGLISAHYCIRRTQQSTTDETKVLTTLIHQLCHQHLAVAKFVQELLDAKQHTGVFHHEFVEKLFLDAVSAYRETVFIIIDALDEAFRPPALSSILSRIIHPSSSNIRLLLATRNEHGVLQSLGDALVPRIVRELPTEDSRLEVGNYIADRLRAGIQEIFGSHAMWQQWPNTAQLQRLSDRADGLFIWARTAVDFVLSRIRKRGGLKRDQLLQDVGKIGMTDVNKLYMFILQNYLKEDEETDIDGDSGKDVILERMKEMLGFIIIAQDPLALDDIIGFLAFDDFDALHFAGAGRSILIPGTDPITGTTLPQVHKTFSDFITSNGAAEFKVELQHLHRSTANRCFSVMETRLRFNICGLRSSFVENKYGLDAFVPKGLIYASTSWWYHLENTHSQHLSSMLGPIQTLLSEKLLFWLEIVSVIEKLWEAPVWMSKLEGWLAEDCPTANVSGANLADFAKDASELLVGFAPCIERSIPHIYMSLLAFSPTDSIVAAHYRKKVATMVIPHPSDIPPHWESWGNHSSMVEHQNAPWSISFSPCGRHLATGYDSGSVRIRDVETGDCILGPLIGHEDVVHSARFSPNGLLLATGSWDHTVRVWDPKTVHGILGPLTGHTGSVFSVSFSPDSTRIASGSADQSIRVWDTRIGECVLGPLNGHSDRVRCVSYSPNGSYIASCSDDETLRRWNAQSGQCILNIDLLKEHNAGIYSICRLSPDGGRLVSASSDGTLRIRDMQTGTCIQGPLAGHTAVVYCACFSPDGRYIASGSDDRTIRIWDAEKAECAIGPIGGAADIIRDVAFSPNGTFLAASSDDGTVRLWDFESLLRTGLGAGDGADAGNTSTIGDHTAVDGKGWTLGPQGERLFWAPRLLNSAIWRPSTIRVLGRPVMIKPDLSNLVTGEEWLQCYPSS